MSISINGDTVASGSSDETCQVWSISENKKLYSVEHKSAGWPCNTVYHVHLLADQKLGFDLITASGDKTIKFWRQGQVIKSLEYSTWCSHFDLDKYHRILAVATGDGVSLWQLETFSKIDENKIGKITNVRFNANATKLIAATLEGSVFEISLQ